jgi:hypothetical protein
MHHDIHFIYSFFFQRAIDAYSYIAMAPKVSSVIAAPILGWGAGSSSSDRIGAAGDDQPILELVEPALQLLMLESSFKLIFKFELKVTHVAMSNV